MRFLSIPAKAGTALATSVLAFVVLLEAIPALAGGMPGSGGRNAPDKLDSPHLVLISIDGFGWDYQSRYETPALDRIAARGVRAESMRPVFPSLTFPNHYSIATGLYPSEHGIVHNHFPDRERGAWYHLWDRDAVEDGRWYGGEPIWVTAEKNGLVSAAYYFVGTEAAINGVSPTYWHRFDDTVAGSERVAQVIDWLRLPDDRRPHMITLYFEHVDDAGHDFGQGSAELAEAVARVDADIGRLLDAIDEQGMEDNTYVLVVSDHGQAGYANPEDMFVLGDYVDLHGVEVQVGGTYAWIYQRSPDKGRAAAIRDTINANWEHGKAVLRDDAPDHWNIGDSALYPEIFVVPDLHYGVVATRDDLHRIKKGDHGWDPVERAMHGIFLARGPRLPEGKLIGEISVIDIQPLMLDLLQIDAANPGSSGTALRELVKSDE